jgi:hypothetical protein
VARTLVAVDLEAVVVEEAVVVVVAVDGCIFVVLDSISYAVRLLQNSRLLTDPPNHPACQRLADPTPLQYRQRLPLRSCPKLELFSKFMSTRAIKRTANHQLLKVTPRT